MNLRKSLLLISIILCIFISLAAVSANENTADLTYADSNSIDDLSLNPVSEEVQEEVSSLGSDLSDEVPEEISSVPVSSEDLSADENSVGNDGKLEENNEENIIQVENNENEDTSQVADSNGNDEGTDTLQYYDDYGYYHEPTYVSTSISVSSKSVYKDKSYTVKVYVNGLYESVGTVYLYVGADSFSANVYSGVATFYLTTYSTGTYYCYAEYYGGYNYDESMYYYSSTSSTFTINVKAKAKISVTNYKSYYNSGKKFKVTVKDTLNGGVHKYTQIKIILYKKGKKVSTITGTTNSKGIYKGTIKKGVGTYKMVVKIAEPGFIYKSATAKAKVIKSKVKLKAYKCKGWSGYTTVLKVSVRDKAGKKVKSGTVKFKIRGKTYKAKVKNGYATKTLKIRRAGTFKYTAKFISKNYYKKTAKSKAKVRKTYKTKLLHSAIVGYQGKNKKVHVYVRTRSGKKVSGGYLYIDWGSTNTVRKFSKKGHAKYVVSLGYNYRGYYYYTDYYGYRHYTYYYDKKSTHYYTAYYYSTSYKYKDCKKRFKVVRKYKCGLCGSKKSHYHGPYYHYVVV